MATRGLRSSPWFLLAALTHVGFRRFASTAAATHSAPAPWTDFRAADLPPHLPAARRGRGAGQVEAAVMNIKDKAEKFVDAAPRAEGVRDRQSLGRGLGADPRRAGLPGAGDVERRLRRRARPARRQGDARRGAGARARHRRRGRPAGVGGPGEGLRRPRPRTPRRPSASPARSAWSAARSRTRPATRTSRSTTSARRWSASRRRCRRRAASRSRSR